MSLDIALDDWTATNDPCALLTEALLDRYADAIADAPALEERLRNCVPDFWAAYASVYGTDHGSLQGVAEVFDAVVDAFQTRSPRLHLLDDERPADWLQHPRTIGIMLYADHFAGTLNGVRERLDYLDELGVTYVHLMPLLKTRPGPDDGGYAVADYRAVNEHLGTIDDVRALAGALHDNGMTLAIDFVMNHTAREHVWAQRARDGDTYYRDLYLTFPDRTQPDAYEESLPEVFPDFAPGNFTYVEAMDRWVWTSFYDFQWDLNYANPDVFVHILREMLFLANVGVDVLRLDAVPFLWKRMGTNCQNQPEAHALLQAYRAAMNVAAPGVRFKAEAIVAPEDVIRYLGAGADRDECDTAYNAALMCHLWHALASENVQLLQAMLTHVPDAPAHTAWLNYVRAHDDIGWGIADEDAARVGQDGHDTRVFCADYYAGRVSGSPAEGYDFQRDPHTGEARTSGTTAALTGLQKALAENDHDAIDQAVTRTLLLHGIVYAMRGIPQLYSGDEIGQLNDLSYLAHPTRARDNRWVHRPPMNWERAERRHDPERVEHRLFYGLKRLADTRRRLDALHGAAPETIVRTDNDRLFLVERGNGNDGVLLVANVSGTAQALPLDALPPRWHHTAYRDTLTNDHHRFASDTLVLPPYELRWLKAAEMDPSGALVPTTIQVDVHTEWGEEVYLVGDTDALGANDPDRAVGPLSAHDYPRWTLDVELPVGTWATFRWLVRHNEHTVRRSPHPFAIYAGTSTPWPLWE